MMLLFKHLGIIRLYTEGVMVGAVLCGRQDSAVRTEVFATTCIKVVDMPHIIGFLFQVAFTFIRDILILELRIHESCGNILNVAYTKERKLELRARVKFLSNSSSKLYASDLNPSEVFCNTGSFKATAAL